MEQQAFPCSATTSEDYRQAVSLAGPRRRRSGMAALMVLLTAVAVVLAALMTGWFLLAVPFTVVWAFAAWLGLSNQELADAFDAVSGDDAGRGPAGLSW